MVGRARGTGAPSGPGRRLPPGAPGFDPGATMSLALVVVVAAGVVVGLDALFAARVRAGTDAALRLSVILNWVGVDRVYVLARALGIGALVMAAGSVVAGLEAGRRRSLGRRPGPRLNVLHRQLSLVTVALVAAHAFTPFASAVAPEGGWSTALVPLGQPVSWGTGAGLAESAGILALYLMVVLGPTWYVARSRPRVWWTAHRAALVVYVLAVVHTLFLGTD
ncbi:MAG TPA: ferric reductase-like transmembrane domain-containing protein, partial [Acidimicrobiales bacterium]|nr:ferric reductase-like transmembrane domain-containing protein [Acidimicrobiales bacterium]